MIPKWFLAMTAALAIAVAGVMLFAPVRSRDASPGRTHETPPPAGAALADGASLYDLDLPLTDANGRACRLADLRGSTYVASMIYTNCTSVCPRITADLQGVERRLPAAARDRERFVLFSLDPERDTPEALRAFAARHHLDPARWSLYAVPENGMRSLAAVPGVRHREAGNGVIDHTAAFAVVDRDGVVRYRQLGLAQDDRPLVDAVVATQR